MVHPELERKLDLNGRTVVFELEWNKLASRAVPQAREISRFPANRRDIAVVVAENVPAEDILAECKKVGANQVVGVNLFDVYRGKGVAEGDKSLGYQSGIAGYRSYTGRRGDSRYRCKMRRGSKTAIPSILEGLNLWRLLKLKCQNTCLRSLGLANGTPKTRGTVL